ncbi:MAG: ABC transporter substrate-binding protein [Gammaproteobacteria bacterium]|nr:ABC transporter substrate-binding protein [Gammaproteobacteria bacterium]
MAGKSPPGELRIVTLAPHLAELVYAAGAGETLVGVSAYSNYPQAVKALPQIGDAFLIDQEQLLLLQPDILLAWESGTAVRTVDELRDRGYRVEVIRTNGLNDIAQALKKIGHLTGHSTEANSAAAEFLAEIDRMHVVDAHQETVRVFYQISSRPLYTVNGDHYVSELIALCGGENIFSDLGALAPLVSEEAVLVRDPEVMIAGRFADDDEPLADWRHWPALTANVLGNFFYVPMDLLARPTPRLAQAGTIICEILEEARQKRQHRQSGNT